MPKIFIRRRLLLALFIAVTLVFTLVHLSSFSAWRIVFPVPDDKGKVLDDTDTSFQWQELPLQHPISSITPLPSGKAPKIPKIQHEFGHIIETAPLKQSRRERLAAVKEAFEHSWKGYKQYAWLHDEVAPISASSKDTFGGWGATLVDSLDTLWIMGMKQDFEAGVKAIKSIDFTKSTAKDINVFETNIRYLGGFLSAYDLSKGKYPTLLEKAIEVGEMLYRSFDTPNHMPITRWDWKGYVRGVPQEAPNSEVVAEIGSLSLEFTRLSQLTSDPKYYDAVQRVSDVFMREQNATHIPGLWPLSVDPHNENMHSDISFTLGGMADSVYEYLPKEYLLLSGRNEDYKTMHLTALDAVKKHLIFQPLIPPAISGSSAPLILGTARAAGQSIKLEPRGEHLACFAGGMIALGARAMAPFQSSAETAEDLDVARRLVHGCVWSYASTPTGIGPEIFMTHPCRKGRDAITEGRETDWNFERGDCTWTRQKWLEQFSSIAKSEKEREEYVQKNNIPEGYIEIPEKKYILRPEAIESLFILYRITGDMRWQEDAWHMFQHITDLTRTNVAFAARPNVMDANEGVDFLTDSMESFWTAETLKYFYLIFSDENLVSLDEYVFNTEAHPLRWRKPSWLTGV